MRALTITLLSVAIAALSGCNAMNYPPPPPASTLPPMILSIDAPNPALRGSLLRVRGLHMEGILGLLVSTSSGQEIELNLAMGESIVEIAPRQGEAFFTITSELATAAGSGPQQLVAVLETTSANSDAFPFNLQMAPGVPIQARDAPTGNAHWNDTFVMHGAGFLAPGEGTVNARFSGQYYVQATGVTRQIDVAVPVLPAERFARDRGIVTLTTSIGGGIDLGTFTGTMTLESQPMGGMATRSMALPVSLSFLPPEIYGPFPQIVSLEQVMEIRGAGFLGGAAADESTVIEYDGTFTPYDGAQVRKTDSLVLQWVSGSVLRGDDFVRAEVRNQRLVSALFGSARGTFEGELTAVVRKGSQELRGAPTPFSYTIGSVQQVVLLRFLPGFYDTLARFGLSAAAGEIEARVQRRMGGIYTGYAMDIRLQRPTDVLPNGFAVVEIGGPDPTGSALFGYDNTPGKDVGNLRLFDQIGGENAQTQSDGQAGYGGVFIESFLLWSAHPGLPRPRDGGPMPDELFDQVFDPVRSRPATLEEVRGMGDATRVDEVQTAINVLASIVGETTAHELGHSLGLAEPRGSRTTFHNSGDTPGCIMDNGGARPFGERAGFSGFTATRFCRDEPAYLSEILPR